MLKVEYNSTRYNLYLVILYMNFITNPYLLPTYYTQPFDGKLNIQGIPFVANVYEYTDVNENKELHKTVTKYFYKELINNWIPNDKIFNKFKNKKMLDTKDGLQLIYKILYKLVKKENTKWWDLRDPEYILTKDYMYYELCKFFKNM